MTEMLSKWIQEHYESVFIYRILESKYEGLSDVLKRELTKIVQEHIAQDKQYAATKMVQEKLETFIQEYGRINLDGFILFALRDYREELEFVIEECFEELLVLEDYHDFIDLLSYFVDVEMSRCRILHIVVNENGAYGYFDEEFHNITENCMNEAGVEFAPDNMDYDDMLLSILMILLPERIVLHHGEQIRNQRILQTIQVIFGYRFKLCVDQHCPVCHKES